MPRIISKPARRRNGLRAGKPLDGRLIHPFACIREMQKLQIRQQMTRRYLTKRMVQL